MLAEDWVARPGKLTEEQFLMKDCFPQMPHLETFGLETFGGHDIQGEWALHLGSPEEI